ncbi:MAG: amino acid decarboxylase [Acidobacteria bacterium]|nr:amino acid decarboxylase [Acidobacteriota bacterium]
MSPEEFRRAGREVIDWLADYQAGLDDHPVLPDVSPGALADKLPPAAPDYGESIEEILEDFGLQIEPHTVAWRHPGFMAYFAAGGSGPGALAETLAAGLNNVGLLWKASPALAELEQVTLRWLGQWLELPPEWFGILHETASEASLHAVIAARESARQVDETAGKGFSLDKVVMYASEHAHMSIEKTMLALGQGRDACRKIAADAEFRMRPEALEEAVERDLAAGLRPIAVGATIGTTSVTSVDPVDRIADVCERHGLWLHVDAAYAGPCAMLPELRGRFAGIERADSFLVNPHKWMWAPMGCSALYTAHPEEFRRAFSLTPDYLRTEEDPRAVNFMEYSIPLGRRFKALKLWLLMRYFGREGYRSILREQIGWAQELAGRVEAHTDFELMAPAPFSLVCLRYRPEGLPEADLDAVNERLLTAINAGGEFFLSPTRLHGRYVIRVAIGNLLTQQRHVERLWELLQEEAARLAR